MAFDPQRAPIRHGGEWLSGVGRVSPNAGSAAVIDEVLSLAVGKADVRLALDELEFHVLDDLLLPK